MIMPTAVSVIMPVYNAEAYISLAIESILNQSLSDFEFLIFDDGSTDCTDDIIRAYTKLDARIKSYSSSRVGLVTALNKLLERSSGKFIARMDSDDISHSRRFAHQVAFLEETGLDIVGCHFRTISSNGSVIRLNQVPTLKSLIDIHLAMGPPFAHGSVMISKNFMSRKNIYYGWSRVYSEDFELWQRMYRSGARFGNVDEVLYDYRDHGSSFLKVKRIEYSSTASILRRRYMTEHQELLLKAMDEVCREPKEIPWESQKVIPLFILKFVWHTRRFRLLRFLSRFRSGLNILALLRFFRGFKH